jgi:hypothetical protein
MSEVLNKLKTWRQNIRPRDDSIILFRDEVSELLKELEAARDENTRLTKLAYRASGTAWQVYAEQIEAQLEAARAAIAASARP